MLYAGPPHFLLSAREGPVLVRAAQRPIPQPGLQTGQGPGSALPPKSDCGLDGPAGREAPGGHRDSAGARQRESPGAGVSGSERVQRREHTVPNGDPGRS